MKVEIISNTENPDLVIATAAKLCYAGCDIDELMKKQTQESIDLFISKLEMMGHESPFEHASFTFAIEGVSRVCEQQFTRHRIASYSIQSGRYVDRSNASFYVPGDIKDCKDAFEIYSTVIESTKDAYQKITESLLHHYIIQYDLKTNFMEQECKYSKGNYYEYSEGCIRYFKDNHKKEYNAMHKKAIENARNIFPNSLETKMIVTMNVRSLWNFFKHRCCFRAQDEIRELALIMLRILKDKFPTLFKHAGASCKSGICPENSMQCEQLKSKIPTMDEVKILIANYYNKKEPVKALD